MPSTPSQVEKLRNHSAIAATSPSTSATCARSVVGSSKSAALICLLDHSALVGGALEAGQVVDHRGDRRGIGGYGSADVRGHG